jgi:hypothetical protein
MVCETGALFLKNDRDFIDVTLQKRSARRGGKGADITPQTGACKSNPAVTAFGAVGGW